MKIAVCLFKYFPYGGLQRDFITISRVLITRGHELFIYTGKWEGEKPSDLNIHILPPSGFSNHAQSKSFFELLEQALVEKPVNLVFGFNKMPGLDVYFCADTCFATKAYEEKNWIYRLTPRCRLSLIYEEAVVGPNAITEVLLLSSVEGKAFQRYYNTSSDRLHLIPPGINRDRVRNKNSQLQGDVIRKEFNISSEEKVIAFLGSDYKTKGLDRLLIAVSSLESKERDRLKVLVIGRDKHLPKFKHLTKKLNVGDRVIFAGQRDDVPELLFSADYLVHPAYLENTGNAILEAVVAGMPVLCTAKCGNSTYIKDNDLGWVIPEPFQQKHMDFLLQEMLDSKVDWRKRCADFANTADIYSSPIHIADIIDKVGARKCNYPL